MNKLNLQLHAEPFDNKAYYDDSSVKATAGKDILLAVWNADGTKLLAIGGQQSLTINRSADSIEINSKDSEGGWKDKLQALKSGLSTRTVFGSLPTNRIKSFQQLLKTATLLLSRLLTARRKKECSAAWRALQIIRLRHRMMMQ